VSISNGCRFILSTYLVMQFSLHLLYINSMLALKEDLLLSQVAGGLRVVTIRAAEQQTIARIDTMK
jgi:hypothetical protein